MLNIRKSFIYLAAILSFAAVSCQLDDTLYYNNLTMGNIVDGRFVSDQGNTFNVVEQACGGKLEFEKRAIVLCDVLCETAGATDEYDVRLRQFATVLEKDAIVEATTTDEQKVEDPIQIEELWFSGGYINLRIRSHVKKEDSQKHLINLVYTKDAEGTYHMTLRHNAFGEVYSEETAKDLVIGSSAYVSFPLTFIDEDEASFTFKWKWYETPGAGYDFNRVKENSFEYKWKREGFEQVPNTAVLVTSNSLK